jgi:hypothetical protein
MGNLILPPSLTRELPYAVTAQLSELPQEAQREFFEEYNRNARTTSIGYILHLLVFGTHYAYLNQWVLQFIYWLTAGGFGIWWFIDLFRIPSMIEAHNNKVADQTLRHVLVKYRYGLKNPTTADAISSSSYSSAKGSRFMLRTPYDLQKKGENNNQNNNQSEKRSISKIRPIAPRILDSPDTDPMRLSIINIKAGYLVDFDLTTWEIVQEWQYDWDNGNSGKEFRLVNEKETLHLYMRNEGTQLHTILGRKVNIFSIDRELEDEIQTNSRPPSVLNYQEIDYFRENTKIGWRHELTAKTSANKLTIWEYFDETMTFFMRIEQIEEQTYKATVGEVISPFEFSNILPKE